MVSNEEFNALFETFEHSVFRLEALDHYWVADDGRFQAFSEGRERPASTPDKDDWLRIVHDAVTAGKRWERVHVIGSISPYVRFELEWGYAENAEAGERICILQAGSQSERDRWPNRDFWLFDDKTVIWMDYDNEGRLVDRIRTTDRRTVQTCQEQRNAMLAAAEPYESFMRRYTPAHA